MGARQEILVSTETSAVLEALADPDRIKMHYQPVLALDSSRVEYLVETGRQPVLVEDLKDAGCQRVAEPRWACRMPRLPYRPRR